MIVPAAIYIGNMSLLKQLAIVSLSKHELREITSFEVKEASHESGLRTWMLEIDPSGPGYCGPAFAREDFVGAVLDTVEDVP